MTALHDWRRAAEGNLLDAAASQPHTAPVMVEAHRLIQSLSDDVEFDANGHPVMCHCGTRFDLRTFTAPNGLPRYVCNPCIIEADSYSAWMSGLVEGTR